MTFDRKVKKDAFYFYKANWNPEPMLYIAGKRNHKSYKFSTRYNGFCNVGEVELLINGKVIGKAFPDQYATVIWKGVKLAVGENKIQVRATVKKKTFVG